MDNNEEYLMIVSDTVPPVPLKNISRKNFIKYELIDNNTLRIWHKQQDINSERWSEVYTEFKISPNNLHMLKVKNW